MCIIWQCKVFIYTLILIQQTVGQSVHESPIASVIRKSMVATAKSCVNHVNATQEDLEYLRNDPPYPEKSSCIIMCLLEKVGVVKNNKYSKTGFMMAVSPLVLAKKSKLEHMKTVSENCDKEVNHHDIVPCQLGNEIITCVYKYAPELHLKS
ncbi:PREDICTED: uncharacterized protein LOC106111140 [Papilio polytes]|uniref:uncharacterized protein LOC106111140 n=1 Tax=Papilio polytes TaxID=76194 RepID=UPI00067646C0|nr:PREDICTED: uncharacterized protein LOC106111140 [Papilio polytes]